ncbi:hypothetical protein [Kitasatospora mediocidica]|uniref:hypothetical protein n=1 Tax=Kitasatospora mediocidica TaxID=58352 RepID=UPI000562DB48|nr:hypothetical protein [Kitasatospora mediocidica]
MTFIEYTPELEELRSHAGAFVNDCPEVWVSVEAECTVVFGGDDPSLLLRAAADWMREGPSGYTVRAVRWERRAGSTAQALCLTVARESRPGAAVQL